jgi:hypothetical protein
MRVVSIVNADATISRVSECEEGHGFIPKIEIPLTRRSFLKGSGILMGTLVTGTTLSALAPSNVWAVELKTLNTAQGQTLMAMGRTLYPHKNLPDAVYALLAKDLDSKATGSQEIKRGLLEGIEKLNKDAAGNFAKASASKKLEIVKTMEGTPFFDLVRGQCVTSLYNNDMTFAIFGYPGAVWEKGGYINRGFQDLKWLPAPDAESSPAPYRG